MDTLDRVTVRIRVAYHAVVVATLVVVVIFGSWWLGLVVFLAITAITYLAAARAAITMEQLRADRRI